MASIDAVSPATQVHLVAAHQVVKVMCNADRPCRDLYAYLRESYPTHKGGSHGAPFVLRLRGVVSVESRRHHNNWLGVRNSLASPAWRAQALPAAILPDDDTKLSDAGVARRQVIDQEVVMSTTVRHMTRVQACACPHVPHLCLRMCVASALRAHLHLNGSAARARSSNPSRRIASESRGVYGRACACSSASPPSPLSLRPAVSVATCAQTAIG